MFDSYLEQSKHRNLLSEILGSGGWKELPRKNPAYKFPTDFLVFQLLHESKDGQEAALASLRSHPRIRSVSLQQRYLRRLLTTESPVVEDDLSSEFAKGTRTGRPRRFSWDESESLTNGTRLSRSSRHLLSVQVTSLFHADQIWAKGFSGAGIKVAIFDTGLRIDHPHFRHITERTNWTDENTLDDGLGHGTFVAGVIAGQFQECAGFAPDVDIHVFRVFTNAQVSYTSWFLDAFNYAMRTKVNILNLSIGGPDFLDNPFVDKVREMSANNIIVVSAIGNDGPLYGTLNNPADQADVIGVGGIDFDDSIAPFSSRGMTTWELPTGYGRPKPDIVAYGRNVYGSRIHGTCRSLSGTSVASPVVAGAVALLASVVPAEKRWQIVNPASMKQALVEGAHRLPNPNIFEQGSGRLDLISSFEILRNYAPRASFFPNKIDLTAQPYFWPYHTQPLYSSAQAVIVNVTILNGMGLVGKISGTPTWIPGKNAEMLKVSVSFSDVLWPWSGFLALHLSVVPEAATWEGIVEGRMRATVVSPPQDASEVNDRVDTIELELKAQIIPTPPKQKRVLWDQYHNMQYPPGYIPRDSLAVKDDILDWNGDHIHTNMRHAYAALKEKAFFVEVLGSPWTCFDAQNYGALLIVDPEEDIFPAEREKLQKDIEAGLSVVILADWYNEAVMAKLKFFDDNTRSWWTPVTGGSNVPALNDLLFPAYGIALGDAIYSGTININNNRASYASGSHIVRFPAGGVVHAFSNLHDQATHLLGRPSLPTNDIAVLGLYETRATSGDPAGRLVVFGDSNCIDEAHLETPCYWLLTSAIEYATRTGGDYLLSKGRYLNSPLDSSGQFGKDLPRRPLLRGTDDSSQGIFINNSISLYSKVVGKNLLCPTPCATPVTQMPGAKLEEMELVEVEEYEDDTSFSSDPSKGPIITMSREVWVLPVLMAGGIVMIAILRYSRRRTTSAPTDRSQSSIV